MTVAERLRARLAETEGDQPLFAGDDSAQSGETIAAAVLIAITDRIEPGLILTQRPETMRRHPGQVAFPGGRVDPGDADAVAAALREAKEEIALDPSQVEVVSVLAPYRTITGFAVTPVVGVIPPDLTLVPHDAEVAAVFEVPLAFALAPQKLDDADGDVPGNRTPLSRSDVGGSTNLGGDSGDACQSGGAAQMVTLPAGGWRSWHSLIELVALLDGDAATRAVGGAVRDTLLDLPVTDIDLATRLLPEEVMARVTASRFKAVPTGLKHGTVTAVTPDGPVEVTTLRRDVATDGRHAEVVFTDDWRADAARRDFTINALYGDISDGVVSDYFGGLDDLKARRVRFIGEPLERIAEDHLRILRFFRFHARFGIGAPDAKGLAACAARAKDLMALSRERIANELLRLLAGDDPAPTLAVMIAHDILKPVLPEIGAAGVERLAALVAIEPEGLAVRRLAALIGPDPVLAADIAGRLRLSNGQSKRLVVAARWRDGGRSQALTYRLGLESAADQLLLRGDAEAAAKLAPPPALPIRGADLLARGFTGPDVGRALARIESAWIEAGFPKGAAFDALVAEQLAR